MCNKTCFIIVHLLVLLYKLKYFTEYLDNIGVDEIYILCFKSSSEGNVDIACHDTWEFESRVEGWRTRIKEWKNSVKQADNRA